MKYLTLFFVSAFCSAQTPITVQAKFMGIPHGAKKTVTASCTHVSATIDQCSAVVVPDANGNDQLIFVRADGINHKAAPLSGNGANYMGATVSSIKFNGKVVYAK